jgi:Leucine-rich repeat (LRR) protein
MEDDKDKYVVYKNDLKFKNMRNIDPTKADWYDDSLQNEFSKDFDNISARLKECKNGGFAYLDLSRLNLEKIPKLSGYVYYDQLIKIKYLFLNDNKLTECGERIKCFEQLKVLDISHNKISQITYLPDKLEELICHNNKLNTIQSHNSIKILDCMDNKIETLGEYPSLKDLLCINNKLTKIRSYQYLTRLICKQNPIYKIEQQPNLLQLDCSETQITGQINGFPNLTGLICNFTKVDSIAYMGKLETLEVVGCTMKVCYIKTLKCLLCDEKAGENIELSNKYKIKNAIKEGSSLCIIFEVT